MTISERAGQPADPSTSSTSMRSIGAYYDGRPDPADPGPARRVRHVRPSRLRVHAAFNEAHILATTEAICRYRAAQGYDGPLFIGRDTHALSRARHRGPRSRCSSAHGVDVRVDSRRRLHADARRSRTRSSSPTAGRDATRPRPTGSSSRPSHNPPEDGGFKYNPPNGGPADTDVTALDPGRGEPAPRGRGRDGRRRHRARAVRAGARAAGALRLPGRLRRRPRRASSTWRRSRASGLRIGVDPMGGAAVAYWARDRRALRPRPDRHQRPASTRTFGFMTCDWDGKIRMDPSSPYAMARLVELRDRFDIALGNDADADRHGIVTPGRRAAEPQPLPARRRSPTCSAAARDWGADVARRQDARLVVDDRPRRRRPRPAAASRCRSASSGSSPGCVDGSLGFGGEESAGRVVPAPRRDASGRPTRTGSSPCLLAARADRADRAATRARPTAS